MYRERYKTNLFLQDIFQHFVRLCRVCLRKVHKPNFLCSLGDLLCNPILNIISKNDVQNQIIYKKLYR